MVAKRLQHGGDLAESRMGRGVVAIDWRGCGRPGGDTVESLGQLRHDDRPVRSIRRIDSFHAEPGLAPGRDLANVSNPYLSQIERGLKRPSAEILQQIARALEVSAESLYVRAGILDEEPQSDLMATIRAQDHLSTDQKQVLIRIYQSFLLENDDS